MRKMPFLRISLALILGIFISNEIELNFKLVSTILLVTGLCNLLIAWFSRKIVNNWNVRGVLILSFFISLGAFAQKNNSFECNKKHFAHHLDHSMFLTGTVKEVKQSKYPKYYVEINTLSNNLKSINVNGTILLKTAINDLKQGDFIQFTGQLKQFNVPKNEYGFDENKFYKNKNIHHFMYSNDIVVLKSSISIFSELRTQIINNIESCNLNQSSKSIVKAMLLGDKSDLGEISKVFRNTGTSHVLAISGLHVGIIATILFFLCSFLPSKFDKLSYILVILGVWVFCVLSGAMPSTIRASVMLTCFLIGKSSGRNRLSYNYCFAAAFLMLLFNPNLIFDIGFQFSFLAIFGILFFYDHIYKTLQFKGVFNYIWQLFSVSLAAQVMITPFSLYYFHEFPLLFLITSLLAIPSTFIIVALSCLSLVLSSSFFDILMLDELLNWFISSFLNLLRLFSDQEAFILKNLYPERLELFLYYVSLFSITTFYLIKKHVFLLTFLISFISLGLYQFKINNSISESQVVIYSHHKDIMIDVFHSGGLTHFFEETNGAEKSNWISKNRRIKFRSHTIENIPLAENTNQLIAINELKIAVINVPDPSTVNQYIDANYILLNTAFDHSCLSTFQGEILDFTHSKYNTSFSNNQIIQKI